MEGIVEAVMLHIVRYHIGHGQDFRSAIAHGYTNRTVFQHRNIYLGITKGDGVFLFST